MNSSDRLKELKSVIKDQEEYIELLEAAINLSMIGYVICDAEGYVLKVNEAQSHITGWEPSAMLGKHMSEIGKVDNHVTATMKIIETQKPIKLERHLASGISFLVYGKPYFDSDNELKYVVCNLIDTTEITQTKNELEKAKLNNNELALKLQQLESRAVLENSLVYNSDKMQRVVNLCYRIAEFDSTILITGESGVGKELIADLIYERSSRNTLPFIKINCASIPEHLLESELFGYEQGSFTGANTKGKKGILEYADQGTLFMDEIGEMSLSLQAKLLRFLQQGEFYRVGGHELIKTDLRILAATNQDLEHMVNQGTFREDLYYRLNVIPIKVPSLKERKDDIPVLIKYFVKKFNQKYDLNKDIELDVIEYFMQNTPKGNIRELQNIVERLLMLSENEIIQLGETKRILFDINGEKEISIQNKSSLKQLVEAYEKELLKKYVKEFRTSQKISEMLQVSQPTISRKLARYGIKAQDIMNE